MEQKDVQAIKAQITITASYDRGIAITVEDTTSGTRFLEINMTKEQFVDATMNRLGCCTTESAIVRNLDRVGKKMEMDILEFPMSEMPDKRYDKKYAALQAKKYCPEGWIPDLYFSSQDSFFIKNELHYARTTIRRWVNNAIGGDNDH